LVRTFSHTSDVKGRKNVFGLGYTWEFRTSRKAKVPGVLPALFPGSPC